MLQTYTHTDTGNIPLNTYDQQEQSTLEKYTSEIFQGTGRTLPDIETGVLRFTVSVVNQLADQNDPRITEPCQILMNLAYSQKDALKIISGLIACRAFSDQKEQNLNHLEEDVLYYTRCSPSTLINILDTQIEDEVPLVSFFNTVTEHFRNEEYEQSLGYLQDHLHILWDTIHQFQEYTHSYSYASFEKYAALFDIRMTSLLVRTAKPYHQSGHYEEGILFFQHFLDAFTFDVGDVAYRKAKNGIAVYLNALDRIEDCDQFMAKWRMEAPSSPGPVITFMEIMMARNQTDSARRIADTLINAEYELNDVNLILMITMAEVYRSVMDIKSYQKCMDTFRRWHVKPSMFNLQEQLHLN